MGAGFCLIQASGGTAVGTGEADIDLSIHVAPLLRGTQCRNKIVKRVLVGWGELKLGVPEPFDFLTWVSTMVQPTRNGGKVFQPNLRMV